MIPKQFLDALEERHFANLKFSEVTRALRALSSTYVERRTTALPAQKALDGAGKRAAFALYTARFTSSSSRTFSRRSARRNQPA